jgi:sugar phosphate isomerase/epimerase
MKRRTFLKASSMAMAGAGSMPAVAGALPQQKNHFGCTLALNAYSFNAPLLAGDMTLDELFRFARATGFGAVDLTAYYINGYPEVPPDETLFGIRRKAFKLGLAISGTGVRNDFTVSDPGLLHDQTGLVKAWTVAASKLGAPHVRVFAGRGTGNGEGREVVKRRIISTFQECADFAKDHGVMIAFQNHYDYIQSNEEVLEILRGVRSEWFGLMLDTGSVEAPDPYSGIDELIPHAITWQVKEQIRTATGTSPTDFNKLMGMVRQHGYRGYFPLETLGEGDPFQKVEKLYSQVAALLG